MTPFLLSLSELVPTHQAQLLLKVHLTNSLQLGCCPIISSWEGSHDVCLRGGFHWWRLPHVACQWHEFLWP
jgi:hypothetical protein